MKVRIYPKFKYWDGEELNYAMPETIGKKKIAHLQNVLNTELEKYRNDPEAKVSTLIAVVQNKVAEYLKPNREKWTEVKFNKFLEYWHRWFGFTLERKGGLEVKDGYLEGEADQFMIDRYLLCTDYQLFNEETQKWESRKEL